MFKLEYVSYVTDVGGIMAGEVPTPGRYSSVVVVKDPLDGPKVMAYFIS